MKERPSAADAEPEGLVVRPNHSFQQDLHKLTGVHALRVVDGPGRQIREHAHDWPVLSLYVSGGVLNRTDLGTQHIASPWVVLYGPGASHANDVGEHGFEQIQIEFDPHWLKVKGLPGRSEPRHWVGGRIASIARDLARLWCSPNGNETLLLERTRAFLQQAIRTEQRERPSWADDFCRTLSPSETSWTRRAAEGLNLSPHWMRQVYRAANGEGIQDTIRRKRVEAAASLLRETDLGASEIAYRCGFCDQSHMIRCFRAVLARTPQEVRTEWRQRSAITISATAAGAGSS